MENRTCLSCKWCEIRDPMIEDVVQDYCISCVKSKWDVEYYTMPEFIENLNRAKHCKEFEKDE